MRIYMQLPSIEGKPPRFYQMLLQPDLLGGWSLVRESGIQGGKGRVKKEHFEEHDEAVEAFMNGRAAQASKGYRVVFMEGLRDSEY